MVYITSGLFGPDAPLDSPTSPLILFPPRVATGMPDSPPTTTAGLGKRKRRLDADASLTPSGRTSTATHTSCSGTDTHDQNTSHQRHSPSSKPLRHHAPSSWNASSTPRPVKHPRRHHTPPKPSFVKAPSHLMDIEPSYSLLLPVQDASTSSSSSSSSSSTSDLRPCHACKTAPKRRRDLENYMECRRCDERTCYICARECVGCTRGVCKKCIVEVGVEGEPWCLECYARMD